MNCRISYQATLCLIALITLVATGCSLDKMFKGSALSGQASGESPVAMLAADSHNAMWSSSMDQALDQASHEGKLVMALFTGSDWCHWCVKLEEEVFSTPEFQSWAANEVVLLKLDYPNRTKLDPATSAQNNQLKERYKIKSYPTVLFLTPNGDVVGKMGYTKGAKQWIAQANDQMMR